MPLFRPYVLPACAMMLSALAACDSQNQFSPDTVRETTAIVLTPASVSLQPSGQQQFTARARLSNGNTTTATVTYQVTGGTIDSSAIYTAGQTAGTYRVIAKQSGGTLADTSVVTITEATAPTPPPSTGRTFFSANAETGNLSAWALPWGVVQYQGTVTATQNRPRFGSWAYRYEVTDHISGVTGHDVRTMTDHPQTSMGGPSGHYMSGYYSFYAYVDAGYTAPGWNLLLGWMTGVDGSPSPIGNIGLQLWNGTLQLHYNAKNATSGNCYTAPAIAGYQNANNGWYFMTASSPAGIKAFPRNQWVHVAMHYEMASRPSGRVRIWQDGVLIMDLPGLDTFSGHSLETCRNSAGDIMLQFGIYGAPKADGVQRLYLDEFKVTDYRPLP
jgi:hypothetical protein